MAHGLTRIDIASKRFGRVEVLRGIRFDLAPGERVALLGPSGIGKSTLLRIVAGVDADFDGSVARPDLLSIVFQEPTLLPWRSALDNLVLLNVGLARGDATRMMGRVGLAGKESHFPGQLSLGQQRRLALARAFAGRPQLLLMDEPFVSLDAETAETMMALTEELLADQRPSLIFVSHDPAEAARLAGRHLHLRGSPATVSEHPPGGHSGGAL